MYKIGDLIFYGNTGVCRVTDIVAHDLSGLDKGRRYYVLQPLYQTCIISTPVNTTKVFMRPIITKAEAEKLIDLIPTIHAEAYHTKVLRQLTDHYEESLQTHDCRDLIELTMSIYAKKEFMSQSRHKFGAMDERYMNRAEDLLFGELAAALRIPKDKVPDYIAERISEKSEENSGGSDR